MAPGVSYFINDPDGGFFIQGAYQIRKASEYPQIDFLSSYGPLSFLLRVFSQTVIGDNLWAEVALVTIFFGISFYLLYTCFFKISNNRLLSFVCLIAALVCFPRYYKFFVVLVPALIYITASKYAESPRVVTAFAMGATVGVAFLFRHDYGAYSLLVALVVLFFSCHEKLSLRNAISSSFVGCFLVVLPWLIVFSVQGSLLKHIIDLAAVTTSYNKGLGLPHPLVNFQHPGLSFLYALIYLTPVLLFWQLLRCSGSLERPLKVKAYCVLAVSCVFLGQSMHRADISHLYQCVAAAILGIPMLWKLTFVVKDRYGPLIRISCYALVILITITGYALHPVKFHNMSSVMRNFSLYRLSMDELADHLMQISPNNQNVKVVDMLRHLPSDRRIMVLPFAPQLAYFSGRLFAGQTLLVLPGYFESNTYQSKMIDSLKQQRPIVIVWNEEMMYDKMLERMPIKSHRLLHEYVLNSYIKKTSIGDYSIYVDREDQNVFDTKYCQ